MGLSVSSWFSWWKLKKAGAVVKTARSNIGRALKVENIGCRKIDLLVEDGVVIGDNVHLRFRGNSSVVLRQGAKIDDGVRIIVSNESSLVVGEGTKIMFHSLVVAGADVEIGCGCGVSAFSVITSSKRRFIAGEGFLNTGWSQSPVTIGDRVQIGTHSFVGPGVSIGQDVRMMPHSQCVVSLEPGYVYGGTPLRKLMPIVSDPV